VHRAGDGVANAIERWRARGEAPPAAPDPADNPLTGAVES
jgi:hypothetical protein